MSVLIYVVLFVCLFLVVYCQSSFRCFTQEGCVFISRAARACAVTEISPEMEKKVTIISLWSCLKINYSGCIHCKEGTCHRVQLHGFAVCGGLRLRGMSLLDQKHLGYSHWWFWYFNVKVPQTDTVNLFSLVSAAT